MNTSLLIFFSILINVVLWCCSHRTNRLKSDDVSINGSVLNMHVSSSIEFYLYTTKNEEKENKFVANKLTGKHLFMTATEFS